MKVRRLGYACINEKLNKSSPRISTNRTIRTKTFEKEDGLLKVSEKSIANLNDLIKIILWNEQRNIKLFRMSGTLFPWPNKWDWEDLPSKDIIQASLTLAGDLAKKYDHRLTFHPGHFNKLCSSDPRVLQSTIDELEYHSKILDFMGFKPSLENSINIHVGAAYGDKQATLQTFCENFHKLSPALQSRLTVENDDKSSLYNTTELYENIHKEIGIPIMFDFHHYNCNPDPDLNQKEAANLAISTWPDDITPLFHWSESKRNEKQDTQIKKAAHSDYCHGPLPSYELVKEIDLMIEAKKKERSMPLLKYADGSLVHKTTTQF